MSCHLQGFQPEIIKYRLLELTPKYKIVNEWKFGTDFEANETKEVYETWEKKIGGNHTYVIREVE